jgi:hypothetical protein
MWNSERFRGRNIREELLRHLDIMGPKATENKIMEGCHPTTRTKHFCKHLLNIRLCLSRERTYNLFNPFLAPKSAN